MQQTITIPSRPEIDFDLLSVDVGGIPASPPGAGIGVKPIGGFVDRLHRLEADLPAGAPDRNRRRRSRRRRTRLGASRAFAGRFRLVLVSATPEPLAVAPATGSACGATRAGGRGGGTGLRRHRHRARRRPAVAVRRQFCPCRDGALGDRSRGTGVPRRLRHRLRRRRLHPRDERSAQYQPSAHLRRGRLCGAGRRSAPESGGLGRAGRCAAGGKPAAGGERAGR